MRHFVSKTATFWTYVVCLPSSDSCRLKILDAHGLVKYVVCPPTGNKKHPFAPLDDLCAINTAHAGDSYVVSNDFYNDHRDRDATLGPWLDDHLISFDPEYLESLEEWTVEFAKSQGKTMDRIASPPRILYLACETMQVSSSLQVV